MVLGNIGFRDCVDKLLDECSTRVFTNRKINVKVCYSSCSGDACNNKPISASTSASGTFNTAPISTTMLLTVTYSICITYASMLRHFLTFNYIDRI